MVSRSDWYIYIEGGTKGTLAAQARQMFTRFLQEKCLNGPRPRVVFSGSRGATYEQFSHGQKEGKNCMLLVDSEEPTDPKITSPWEQHRIKHVDGWKKPAGATDDDLHFMTTTMETWLVASDAELAEFFGKGFRSDKLSKATDLEAVPKNLIMIGLEAATANSSKGKYGKGLHSFKALAGMDPEKIRKRCPKWAVRFCDELHRRSKASKFQK
jgi:hypothetical protein